MKFVFFPVLENGENGLDDERADGAIPPPQNFWARTTPAHTQPDLLRSLSGVDGNKLSAS